MPLPFYVLTVWYILTACLSLVNIIFLALEMISD